MDSMDNLDSMDDMDDMDGMVVADGLCITIQYIYFTP